MPRNSPPFFSSFPNFLDYFNIFNDFFFQNCIYFFFCHYLPLLPDFTNSLRVWEGEGGMWAATCLTSNTNSSTTAPHWLRHCCALPKISVFSPNTQQSFSLSILLISRVCRTQNPINSAIFLGGGGKIMQFVLYYIVSISATLKILAIETNCNFRPKFV